MDRGKLEWVFRDALDDTVYLVAESPSKSLDPGFVPVLRSDKLRARCLGE